MAEEEVSEAKNVSRGTVTARDGGWYGMACWNALSDEQQARLVEWGNLPLGYRPEGTRCGRPAEVAVECADDAAPGIRFYCLGCACLYLAGKYHERHRDPDRATTSLVDRDYSVGIVGYPALRGVVS